MLQNAHCNVARFLRAKAAAALARLIAIAILFVSLSVCPSVCRSHG